MHLNEQEPHLSIGIEEETFNELRQQAIEARSLSYSPYSHFKVGCCLLTKSNDFIKGANIENASYGATICAERTAIVKAVTGDETDKWVCLAISGESLDECITPCGICRQTLREFVDAEFPIVMFNGDGSKVKIRTLNQLLPDSFGPDNLQT
ncbi:hypothetical protein NCAS_0C02910 [Naumovozyma castellii]|uniref:Cytidine deaminase n=1 Tax=Naumovozyma castellii TaxID=27288 RepID=G0VCS1_NAUCA|nr:hypothetical protein NCAS_0C02910 [Naumovozyma castellii CBS 4309]CCC69281.1 hypothetical protein NCAS_0C02910 [Naumovozyma castellii CBS 4309]